MSDWSFARVWSAIAATAPAREAIVCGGVRRTWAEFDERAARLAGHLHERGIRQGEKVAIDLVNRPEYLETFYGALKLGCVPVNVNYRYGAEETGYVVDDSDAKVVVHEPQLAKTVRQGIKRIAKKWRPFTIERGDEYEAALAAASPTGPWCERAPSGDDLVFLYTGGTTGMPKGVMWRSDDLYVALWEMGRPGTEPPDPSEAVRAGKRAATALPACPLMHGTGLFIALSTLSGGGTVVLVDSGASLGAPSAPGRSGSSPTAPSAPGRSGSSPTAPSAPGRSGSSPTAPSAPGRSGSSPTAPSAPGRSGLGALNPERIWDEVERNDVQVLTIVGDVFGRPLLAALDAEPDRWDLGALRAITSSGVTWSPAVKRGLLGHLPSVTLLDSLGASEGLMTRSAARAEDRDIPAARFTVNERVRVLREGDDRDVTPGSDEVGMLAVGGRIPLGYYLDPEKTAKTFRVVQGRRYAIPGDYAAVEADGTIRLLGRGSATVNTGGEKVYPEEVELLLKKNKAVYDCVVVGVPDPRFGEIVVALVQVSERYYTDEAELRAFCRSQVAGYKTPKRILFTDSLRRAANGKADYKLLKEMAADLLEVQRGV